MATSLIRQNYHSECEASVNRLANMNLFTSYTFLSMAQYFERGDVALPGFAHFFKKKSKEDQENAEKLMSYQNKRGGTVFLQDIKKPERDEWGSGLEAMQSSLQMKKSMNQYLLDMHKMAAEKDDPHLCHFLESHYLNEHVEAIKKLGDYITLLNKMDAERNKFAEFLFDRHTLKSS